MVTERDNHPIDQPAGAAGPAAPALAADIYERLGERVGRAHLAQRLDLQMNHVADIFGTGLTRVHIENATWVFDVLRVVLKSVGMYGRGQRNARDIRVVRHAVRLPRLADAFDGFTLLHLSDLHLDICGVITEAILGAIAGLRYDVCVITGDFRSRTFGSYDAALADLGRLATGLRAPAYAVLGNHDFIEMTEPIEAAGIRVLLNESVVLRRGAAALNLAGMDDPHFYEVDNIQKVVDGIDMRHCSVLLSHSPEVFKKAAAVGFDLMLAGHTHAGQICLPGGFPVIANARAPRRMIGGSWTHGDLVGYTSRGTGCSGLDVRYNCPPEVTLHTLEACPGRRHG